MWKSAYVGVYQLLNWKMQGETLKFLKKYFASPNYYFGVFKNITIIAALHRLHFMFPCIICESKVVGVRVSSNL